jgi:hypothetical protein
VRSGAADDWVVLISHHQKSRKGRVENWVGSFVRPRRRED